MTTPIFNIAELATSIVSFTLANSITRSLEAASTNSVINTLNTPPVSPVDGFIVIVDAVPTGVFIGQENNLAVSIGGAWFFLTMGASATGYRVYHQNLSKFQIFNGTDWINDPTQEVTTISSAVSATLDESTTQIIDATAAALVFTLPVPLFGGTKITVNNSGANSFDLDYLATSVVTVNAGLTVTVVFDGAVWLAI